MRATKLNEQVDRSESRAHHGDDAMLRFVIDERRQQHVTNDSAAELRPGSTVLSLAADNRPRSAGDRPAAPPAAA